MSTEKPKGLQLTAIRDDGPLPDTVTDVVMAADRMRQLADALDMT